LIELAEARLVTPQHAYPIKNMKCQILPIGALTALTVLLSASTLHGQSSSFNLAVGAGLPELLNAGLSFNARKAVFGATIGTFPAFGEKILSAGVNGGFHFAGKSEHTSIPPWYTTVGFNYIRDRTEDEIEIYTYLNVRMGRQFNFSPRTALALDAGVLFETSYGTKGTGPGSELQPGNSWFPVLPALGARLIYRLVPGVSGDE